MREGYPFFVPFFGSKLTTVDSYSRVPCSQLALGVISLHFALYVSLRHNLATNYVTNSRKTTAATSAIRSVTSTTRKVQVAYPVQGFSTLGPKLTSRVTLTRAL